MDLAAYKNYKESYKLKTDNLSVNNDEFSNCNECGSKNTEFINGECVCKNCGLVLETIQLIYNQPYEALLIQVEKDRSEPTQIGTITERKNSNNARKYEKLQKIHKSQDNEKNILKKAKVEMNRIFNALSLPFTMKNFVFGKFKLIRSGLKPSTKYRSPESLIPIVIYMSMKVLKIAINETDLVEVSNISKKDFNSFKLLIGKYYPQYYGRNRKDYISLKILDLQESYGLDMNFYHISKKILDKFWGNISSTKDDVIAGLVSSMSLLTSFSNSEVTVNQICAKLNIKMSTISSQVKKNFIERYRIQGYESLVKSSDILTKILKKFEIIKVDPEEPQTYYKNKLNYRQFRKYNT